MFISISNLKAIAATLWALIKVFLADYVMIIFAHLFLMGDKDSGDYTDQYRIIASILTVYLVVLLCLGYEKLKQRSIPKAIILGLGALPIVLLLVKYLYLFII